MEKIASLAHVSYILLLTPFMSYMLVDFMQAGMIFESYGKWLQNINPIFAKPLGLCLKCFHVWIVFFVALFFNVEIDKFIITLPISYVILIKLFFD